MGDYVRIEVDGEIATIRLDRPPMNALSIAMQAEIRECAEQIAARSDIRAVIVYGGPNVFAAGADVKEMATMPYEAMLTHAPTLQRSFNAVAAIPQPTIAAVTGYALGGGCELAMCADFRVSGDNAKWGQPEIALGIIPGAGGTQRLPRLVGVARAKEIIFGGRFVAADEAHAIGLVDKVVAPDGVYDAALTWARQLARGPALALRAAKHAIDAGGEVDLATGLGIESAAFAQLFGTADRTMGMESFVADGPGKARFTGAPMDES